MDGLVQPQDFSCVLPQKRVYWSCGVDFVHCVGGQVTCTGAKEWQFLCTAVFCFPCGLLQWVDNCHTLPIAAIIVLSLTEHLLSQDCPGSLFFQKIVWKKNEEKSETPCAARVFRFVLIITYGHTFATHALARGVDAKTLSGILGHTKASFTLDTYAHITDDMQRHAARIVGDFIQDIL